LARQLKQVGYTTGVVGKMHFNRRSEDGLYGFDMVHAEDWIARNWNAQPHKPVPPEVPTKPRWRPFQDHARTWLNSEKLPYPRFYDDMRGTFIARQAAAYLKEHRDRPFALWVSFPDPHSPYDFSVDDRDVFQPGQFQAPPVGPEDAWQVPLIFRDLTPLEKQGIAASYYTSTWQLDRNVGEVLAALRGLRLEENTLVVYIGDNGYCLGEHGRFEKHCGYEPALRVPLIVRQPGKVRRRAVVRDLTEMVDVSATILDMLGAPPIPGQHGQSLRPYLEGRAMPRARDHVFSEYLENEEAFIRTNRWKFIFCSGSRERGDGYKTDRPTPGRYLRLYDLKNDPGEFVDVSSKHRDITARMQELMLARFRATHPDAKPEADLEYYLKPRDA
jgi:choline-sulfatase